MHYNRVMASRTSPKSPSFTLGEFDRTVDQLFEELLISRWRGPHHRGGPGHALVLDHDIHFEVRIAAAVSDPAGIEVEVAERRLHVRIASPTGPAENVFDLSSAVDPDRVTARWERGTLYIILPKKRGRRVEVK